MTFLIVDTYFGTIRKFLYLIFLRVFFFLEQYDTHKYYTQDDHYSHNFSNFLCMLLLQLRAYYNVKVHVCCILPQEGIRSEYLKCCGTLILKII